MTSPWQDHIDAVVAAAPPPTREQANKVARLLYPEAFRTPQLYPAPSPTPEEISRREDHARMLAEAQRLSASILACDICDLPPKAHEAQQAYGQYHEWTPGRAARVLKAEIQKIELAPTAQTGPTT